MTSRSCWWTRPRSKTESRELKLEQLPKRILLVRAGALGDTLMATPALRALKQHDPEAEIDFLCSQAARPLLEENTAISRIFSLAQRNVPFFVSLEKRRLALE